MRDNDINMERLGKLVRMAKHGQGGEKDVAIKMVKNLCKKYNLDFDEVMDGEVVEKKEYQIKYKNKKERNLILHILLKFGKGLTMDDIWMMKYYKIVGFKTTPATYIEVVNAVDVLIDLYRSERKRIMSGIFWGFMDKHDLYYNNPDNSGKRKKMSNKEMEARMMGNKLAKDMKDAHILKRLPGR